MTTSSTATVADVLNCGHQPTPDPSGIGTGRAIDPITGATSCYPCSDERERHAMTREHLRRLCVLGRRRADHLARGVPMWLSSRSWGGVAVVGAVAEHGVEDVAVASGQADEGGVVFLAFSAFAVVVGP